jgi:hypothetical protein
MATPNGCYGNQTNKQTQMAKFKWETALPIETRQQIMEMWNIGRDEMHRG